MFLTLNISSHTGFFKRAEPWERKSGCPSKFKSRMMNSTTHSNILDLNPSGFSWNIWSYFCVLFLLKLTRFGLCKKGRIDYARQRIFPSFKPQTGISFSFSWKNLLNLIGRFLMVFIQILTWLELKNRVKISLEAIFCQPIRAKFSSF